MAGWWEDYKKRKGLSSGDSGSKAGRTYSERITTDEHRQAAKSSTWWEDYKKKNDLERRAAADRQRAAQSASRLKYRSERNQRFASANRQLDENRSRDATEDAVLESMRRLSPWQNEEYWEAQALNRNSARYQRDLPLYQQIMQNSSGWGEYIKARREAGEAQSAVKHQFARYQQAAKKATADRDESNLVNRPAQWQAENLSPQEIERRLAYYRSEAATPTVTDRDREEHAYLYPEAALQKVPHGARFDERLLEGAGQDAIDALYRPILTEQEKAAVEQADRQIIEEKAERNYEQVQRLLAAQAGQTETASRARGNELIEEIAQGGEAANKAKTGKAMFEQQQKKIDDESPTIIYGMHGNYSSAMAERTKRGYILGSDWDNVPEDRKQAVYALFTESPEKAIELAKFYIADVRQAEDEEQQAWYAQSGLTSYLGLAASAAAHLGSAVDPFGPVGQELTRYGDNALAGGSQWADAATGYQKIPEWVPVVGGKGAGDFYQTTGSVVQSLAVAAPAMLVGRYDQAAAEVVGKLGLVLMGSSAAASDYRESVAAGMDEDRAKLHALAAGVEEALFEEVSLDKLIKMDTSGGLKSALKNWLVQSGIEGSEELATGIANRITDELISGAGQSKVERRASELIANGMSAAQAHTQAESEWMTDTLYEGFSGILSGGMMTGGNYALQGAANLTERAVSAVETRKAQKQAGAAVSRSEGSVEALQAYAKDKGIEIKAVETTEQNAGESTEQGDQEAKQNNYSNRDYRSISDTNSKVVQSIRSEVRGKTAQEQQAVRDSLVEKYGEGIAPVVNNAISIETAARVRQEYGNVDSIQAARNRAVSEIKDESLRRAVSDGYDSAAYSLAASQGGEGFSRYIQQRNNTGTGEMSMNATVTAQDGSTKAIAITGMSEDGKRVSLADGSEVAVKDLQADADTTSAIQQLADLDLGADATKVLQAYQQSGVAGTEGYRWLMDYATAYNQGRTRQISLEQAAQRSSLDERTVMDAYTLGQQAANRETLAGLEKLKNLPKRKGASGRASNIDTTEIKGKTMSKSELEQFALANQYAQALGVDVKWFSSKKENGRFVGKNGAYENGKIYMDIHAGRNFISDLRSGILATIGHELTHFQQQYAPEEYQALKEFLFEQIVKSSPNGEARLERLIWEKQRRSGYTLSRKAAEDEVVADACQKMLRDSKVVHDFASQQPEAANGVVRWLDKWFKRVRSIFGRGGNYSEEAQLMDSLEQDVKAAFGELWDKALKQAVQVHDEVGNIEKPATEGESKAQNSDRDAEYLELAKDPEKNAAKLQEMVEEAARKAGYTSPMLFHGTNAFGFTTIKTSKDVHADGFSFWAANKESAAGTYARYGKTREIESEISYEETEEAIEERSADVDGAIDDFRYLIDRTFSEWFYGQQGNEVIRRGVDDSNPDPGSGDGVYDFLVDQVADAFDEYSDALSETYEDFSDFQERSEEWQKIEDAIVAIEGAYSALSEIQSEGLVGGIYELYANTDNMYVVDAKGAAWDALHPEGLPKIERGEYKNIPYKTRDVANWARDNGYDGVIYKNIKDNGAYGRTEPFDVYAFFNPQAQVKSADPVTYDDSGNVIPLSERFNAENQDIRYSERDNFAGETPVEAVRDLIAVHNMTEQNLRDVLELGGFPSPSIAIVKAVNGHTNYGPISVVFKRDSIDPELNKLNKIYGADAWTPTFRNSRTETEVDTKKLRKLDEKLWELNKKIAGGAFSDASTLVSRIGYDGATEYSLDEILDRVSATPGAIAAYLADKGISVEPITKGKQYDPRGNDFLQKIIDAFGAQQLADIMARQAQGEEMSPEEMAKVREIYLQDVVDKYSPALKQRRGLEFLRKNAEERSKDLGPWKFQAFVEHAWEYYEHYGNDNSEIDYDPTLEAMKQAIDPEHRVDGLLENKIKKTVGDWLRPQIREVLGKKGIYNGKDLFTPAGTRRSFWQLHDAYTLENIVKAMNRTAARGNSTFGVSAGSLQAVSAPEYKSISEVRANKNRLARVDEENYKRIRKEVEDRIPEITSKIAAENTKASTGNTFEDLDIIADLIIMAANGPRTVEGVQRTFQRESDFKISKEQAKEILQLYKDAANIPTEYFEAKPQRAMGFGEVQAVILPSDMDHEIVQGLQGNGVPVMFFEAGNDAERTKVLNSLDSAKFSERDYSTPSDEELLMNASVEDAESPEARAALQNSQKQARQIRDLTRRLERLQTEIRGYEGDSPNRISVQRFTRQALDLFGIPAGVRTDMGELLQSVAEGVLAGHNLSQNDIMYFFETLITNGREKTVADETLAEIRDDLKGRKIYVNENVKAEFGDDWNAFRKRAFSLGIQLTNNEKNMGIDSVNAELAELYPGKFDADETDLRSILENIVDTAESGKTSDVPILDAMREIQKQTGEPVREQLQTMLDQFTRQIEIMQDQAAVERKARAGNAAEIAKARKQINEAKEALREVRKQRDAWKRKSEGADARQKRALDAALRGVVQHDAKQIAEAVRQKQALAKKLQDQIDREKKILSGELRAPGLVKLLKAEREKAETRVKEQKEAQFASYKERKAATDLRGRIKNLSDEMKRRMTNPTDRAYVPASLYQSMTKLADVLDNVLSPNPGTKAEARYRAMMDAIRGMAREYEDVKNLDPVFASEYEQEISDAIGEIERILERKNASWIDNLTGDTQKGLAELNSDELQQLYDLMRQINYTITNATKVFGNSNYKSIFDAQRAVAEQQNSMKSLNAVSRLERKKRLRLLNGLSVMRATEMMAGWDRSAALYQLMHGIEQGADDAWAWVMDYNKSMQDLKTGKNEKEYRQALTKQLDFGITDRDGLKVTMTKMQALQILMTAEREEHNDKLLHLQAGGAVIRNATDLQNGKGAKARSQTISVTPELIQKIRDNLTEWDRAYMKTVRDYFKQEGKRTNEILYKLKHKVLKTEEFYVPYTVDRNYLEANLNEQQALNMWVKTPGSTNALKQKAKQPVIIDGMDTVMGQHVKEIGNYIGMAIPIRDFSKVYNGMIPTEGPNPLPVKETIERTFGKAGQHLLTQAVIDVQGGTARQNWESNIAQFLNKLQGAFVRSALLINPSVTIKQAASYIAAESVISHLALERGNHPVWARTDESKSFMPGGLIAQLFARPEGKTAQRIYNEIDQHTSLHYQRRQGMSMAEIAEQANRTGPIKRRINAIGASMEQSKIGHAVRRTGENLNPITWIQRMDVATTAALWVACKEQAKLEKLTVGSEEFWKRTTELYERCIRETQPMYDGLHRTANQKQAGGLMQYLFPFRTVPIQNHGQLAASYEAYKAARESKNEAKIKEAGKFFRKTAWAQTESAFVFSAMTFLAAILKRKTKKYRDEEGEFDAGSFTKGLLTDVGSTLISVLNPMYGSELFNLGSRAVDKFEGNSGYTYDAFSVGVVDMINDLASSGDRLLADAGKIVRGENVNAADFWNHALNLLLKGGKLAGIPADTVKTYFEGTKGNIQDAIDGRIPALNDESWERDAATNARRYLKAYLDNDTQKASAVLAELRSNLSKSGKNEEKINEAIRKAVSAQAIEKVADGTWTEEEAEAYLLSTGAYDDRENPQKDAWNAIRKGVAKSTSTDEEFNWKQYDDLSETVANGEDVTGLLAEYRNHGYSDDQINAAIRSGIQEALTAGYLDGNEAADALIRYGVTYSKNGKDVVYDEQTAWKKVQEWADKAEHTDEQGELEDGYKYSAYTDLFDAVDANQNADGVIQTMVQNGGYDTDGLRSKIKEHLLERFIAGQITETALKNQLSRYCKISKADDANEIVANAKCKRDFGVYPDDLKEAFKDGDLSQNQAEKALQQYKGLSKADAQNRVQYWGYDGDLSENAWAKWAHELKSTGLSVDNWEKVYKVKISAKGTDANGDGRADSGTVKAEVVAYIDSMNIPKSQKKAIYLAFGWAASTMPNWR